MSRAALKAAVERQLNADTTVIADAMNYIKGFRYELHCLTRSAATTQVCLWVDAPPEVAGEWNTARAAAAAGPEGGTASSMAAYTPALCVLLLFEYKHTIKHNGVPPTHGCADWRTCGRGLRCRTSGSGGTRRCSM